MSPEATMHHLVELMQYNIEVTDVLVEEFEKYLENIDQYCCDICGWWVYPGEICECEEDDL